MIDWLIDYCLTSIEQYFSCIQNKFNNIGKLMKWKKLGRDEKFSLCSSYSALALFRNLHNRSLECRECGSLQMRCPLSSTVRLSVLYPDNPPIERDSLYSPPGDALSSFCFWALGIFTSTQTGLCYLYQSTKGTMKINFKMLFIKRKLQMTDGGQVFFHMIYFLGCISLLGQHLCCLIIPICK